MLLRVSTIGGKIRASNVVSMSKAWERGKQTLRLKSRRESCSAKISEDSKNFLKEHYSSVEVYENDNDNG